MKKTYPEIRKVFKDQIPDVMVCHQEGQQILGKYIPIAFLSEFLMTYFS